jgi:hypothetical protein
MQTDAPTMQQVHAFVTVQRVLDPVKREACIGNPVRPAAYQTAHIGRGRNVLDGRVVAEENIAETSRAIRRMPGKQCRAEIANRDLHAMRVAQCKEYCSDVKPPRIATSALDASRFSSSAFAASSLWRKIS